MDAHGARGERGDAELKVVRVGPSITGVAWRCTDCGVGGNSAGLVSWQIA